VKIKSACFDSPKSSCNLVLMTCCAPLEPAHFEAAEALEGMFTHSGAEERGFALPVFPNAGTCAALGAAWTCQRGWVPELPDHSQASKWLPI